MNKNEMFRMIPKIDILLKQEGIKELAEEYGRQALVGVLQEILEDLRTEAAEYAGQGNVQKGAGEIQQMLLRLPAEVHDRLQRLFRP